MKDVFGKDHPGLVRGMGPTITTSKYFGGRFSTLSRDESGSSSSSSHDLMKFVLSYLAEKYREDDLFITRTTTPQKAAGTYKLNFCYARTCKCLFFSHSMNGKLNVLFCCEWQVAGRKRVQLSQSNSTSTSEQSPEGSQEQKICTCQPNHGSQNYSYMLENTQQVAKICICDVRFFAELFLCTLNI